MTRPLLALCALLCSLPALALQQRQELSLEFWQFSEPGAQGQANNDSALSLRSEFWHDLEDDRFSLTTLVRADQRDAERSHFDVREALWNHLGDGYELRAGVAQVFWGVTEGEHLVDIINQTDQVESLDGEQKLGQPLLDLAIERDQQMFDLFVLAGARERSFAGTDGRLRLPLVVDDDLVSYESARGNRRLDLAARWQLNLPALRLGITGFSGTAREPELLPVVDFSQVQFSGGQPSGFAPGYAPVLAPYYPLINQFGLDLQVTQGDLLWKLEAIQRNGGQENFHASDAGFEYTQVGVFDSQIDIGWLAEYLYDSRGNAATTAFEHDVLAGIRLVFNDTASSDLLLGVIVDERTHEQLLSAEASTRFGDDLRGSLELRHFGGSRSVQTPFEALLAADSDYKLRNLSSDNFLRLELTWFL